jgi:hypothetical protein
VAAGIAVAIICPLDPIGLNLDDTNSATRRALRSIIIPGHSYSSGCDM